MDSEGCNIAMHLMVSASHFSFSFDVTVPNITLDMHILLPGNEAIQVHTLDMKQMFDYGLNCIH